MSSIINKELKCYINSDIFIICLNIPLFELSCNNSFDEPIQQNYGNLKAKLELLMILPHQEFWCHVLYDRSVLQSLQSFLNNAKRPHELQLENRKLSNTENELYGLYYKLVLRILTYKEINVLQFSSHNYGSLIYDNYIVDVPTIFDICAIFGEGNLVISKAICGIITCQKLYLNDIECYADSTIQCLKDKLQNLMVNGNIKNNESAKTRVNQHLLKKSSTVTNEVIDVLHYFIDFSRSWNIFLSCVESMEEIFTKLNSVQFHKIIEVLFEKIVPFSKQNVNNTFHSQNPETIKQLLSVLCYYLIEIWRKFFTAMFIKKFNYDNGLFRSSEDNYSLIGECVAMIQGCQENSEFADAMYLMYPLQADIDVLYRVIKSDKDEYYSDYVNESLKEVFNVIKARKTLFSSSPFNYNGLSNELSSEVNDKDDENHDIQQIIDIYSDLLPLDIHIYMKKYSCSAECMLESLLEEAIDVSYVKEVSNIYVEEEILAEEEDNLLTESILKSHKNIYDGDEFDSGKVKPSQIHIGKRQSIITPVVDSSLKNLILGIVTKQEEDSVNIINNENDLYDDEFDDVYGISHDGAVNEKNTEDIVIESETIHISQLRRAHRITNITNTNDNKVKGVSTSSQIANAPTLMEPSALKYSQYNKNQSTKKRFQDHQPQNQRQGSHSNNNTTKVKKDHRPKGARQNPE